MKKDYSDYILPVGLIALFLFFGDKVVNLFKGVFGDSPTVQKNNKRISDLIAAPALQNPWDRRYLDAVIEANPTKPIKYMKVAAANALVDKIYDSVGFWTGLKTKDNTHEIQAAFMQVHYKTQVSQIAGIFYKRYAKDLLSFLQYDTDKYGMFSGSKHAKIVDAVISRVDGLPIS